MAGDLRFDGKVVLVTGAGGGLGKAYALAFAERGAKVVVNDLGGDISGGGASSRPAQLVVDEIKAKGGQAVANYDSVEEGEKLVKAALDNFGRIDIVINNAGILRDRSFARTSDQDWDIIHRVHLRGSFLVSRAAWPHMKNQNYGRIIMTSSSAGLYGNFGQANYSAAKLGLLGLSKTLAIEGEKYNIKCNTIAPMAGSRLTATVMPPEMLDALKPEYVAPLVLWLCHESCQETGGCFEVGAGWAAKLRWQRTKGAVMRKKDQPFTAENVRDNWNKVTDFTEHSFPAVSRESTMSMLSVLQEVESSESSGPSVRKTSAGGTIDLGRAVGHRFPERDFTFTERDVILYALGVGMNVHEPDHLKFLFELDQDFSMLPTFPVITAFSLMTNPIPGFEFDLSQVLHGEQYVELFKPLPTSGTWKSRGSVVDIIDKGSGAVLIINVESFDEKGDKIALTQFTSFIRKMGGFGGKRASDKAFNPVDPPKRAPDASVSEKTDESQAALYRLNGDRNPLHIDPSFAAMGGFSKPILHGLCTFGFAARHVLKQFCNNDPSKFKAIKVRFSKPVLPGHSLKTDMWKEGDRVYFRTTVPETGDVCLTGGYVDLRPGSVSAASDGPYSSGLQSDLIFAEVENRLKANPDIAKKVKAIIQFNVTDGKNVVKKWVVDMQSSPPSVSQGEPKVKAGMTVTVSDENFINLASGQLSGQQAFMTGKIKVQGNLMLAQKLSVLFQEQSKL